MSGREDLFPCQIGETYIQIYFAISLQVPPTKFNEQRSNSLLKLLLPPPPANHRNMVTSSSLLTITFRMQTVTQQRKLNNSTPIKHSWEYNAFLKLPYSCQHGQLYKEVNELCKRSRVYLSTLGSGPISVPFLKYLQPTLSQIFTHVHLDKEHLASTDFMAIHYQASKTRAQDAAWYEVRPSHFIH